MKSLKFCFHKSNLEDSSNLIISSNQFETLAYIIHFLSKNWPFNEAYFYISFHKCFSTSKIIYKPILSTGDRLKKVYGPFI